MVPIPRAMALRFLRQGVWIAALILPAAWGAAALALRRGEASPGPEVRAAAVLLGFLQYLLPALAAIFLLSSRDRRSEELLLSRPIGWPGIILGRWAGAVALFGSCHLLLSIGFSAALLVSGGGPPARVYREPDARLLGEPLARPAAGLTRPWPGEAPDPLWLDAVRSGLPWIFEFSGLEPGRPYRARARALIARVLLTERSGGVKHRELARADSIPVEVSFAGADGRMEPAGRVELRDGSPVDLEVPPAKVGPDGRLRVVLSPVAEEGLLIGDTWWGPRFFWFDPDGPDPLEARDLRVVIHEIPFARNALRAALSSLGQLFLVAALAGASAALLSPGLAFGLTLTIYSTALALPFLQDAIRTLSHQSAWLLLEDPAAPPLAAGPSTFERLLQSFLALVSAVLPDLERFQGSRSLSGGEAVRMVEILRALGSGAGYALVFLGAALLGLVGRDFRR